MEDKTNLPTLADIRLTEEKFSKAFRIAPDSININRMADGMYIEVNEAFTLLTGYTAEEVIGKTSFEINFWVNPQDRSHLVQILEERGEIDNLELPFRNKNGDTKICLMSSRILEIKAEKFILSIARDITERKLLEKEYSTFIHDITELKHAEQEILRNKEALDRQMALFNSLLKNIPIGVFMVEAPSGKPLLANEAAFRFLGRGILPDATKENLAEVYEAYKLATHTRYPPDEMPIVMGMLGMSAYVDDMLVVRPDKTETLLEVIGTPVTDPDGKVWASLVCFQDITERKTAENKNNVQLEELRRWHAITLGRERRIRELKGEVNELLKKNGLPVRYASALENSDA